MKTPTFHLFVWLIWLGLVGFSHSQEPQARFVFIVAIGGEGRSFVEIDGKDVSSSGHLGGTASGWLGVPAGDFKLKMEHELYGIADATTKLKEGDEKVFILHTETSPGRKEGRPSKKESRVTVLDVPTLVQGTGAKKRLVIYSVSKKPDAKVFIGGKEIALQPMQPVVCSTAGVGLFPAVEIANPTPSEGAERLSICSVNLESSGVQLVVIFDGDEKQPLMAATVSLPGE